MIGEDTDLLVLLCHYAERGMNDLHFKTSKKHGKCWHINSIAEALGESIYRVLPVVLALCGCDTTSRLYGIGKGAALRKLREDNGFLKCMEAFCGQSGSKDAISSAGEEALVYLYGEKEMTPLTDCERQSFATRWQKIQLPLKFTAFPQQPMQPNTTCSEFIVRSRDGWGTVWTPRNRAGVCGGTA